MRRLVLLMVVALAAAACGEATPEEASEQPTETSRPPSGSADVPVTTAVPVDSSTSVQYPATSLVGAPVAGSLPEGPVFIDPDERCPERDLSLSFGDGQAMTAESGRLEPMIGRVLAYGTEHADEFGTYGLIWLDAGDASVFISLTGDLDAHRGALAEIVEYPDELIVCQAALSGEANQAMQEALRRELTGRLRTIGQGYASVEIGLPANEVQLADELVSRFGDMVTVTVGLFAYPMRPDASPPVGSCTQNLAGPTEMNGLTATLVFDEPSAGANELSGTVIVTNTGDQPASFSSGSTLVAPIVRPGTTTIVGVYDGVLAGPLGGALLQPGESHTLPVVAGLASCDPGLGYVLPPGDYEAIAPVVIVYSQEPGGPNVNQLVTGRASITIPG